MIWERTQLATLREAAGEVRLKLERVADIENPKAIIIWIAIVNLPGASVGKLFNFIRELAPPIRPGEIPKEKANRGLMQPYAGLAGPFPRRKQRGSLAFSHGSLKEDSRKSSDPHLRTSPMRSFYSC